jgi:hypothetical protein
MHRDDAEKLSVLLLRIGGYLNQSTAFVRDHDDEAEFLEYRRVVGKLMGDLYLDLMEPLWRRFPELRPDDMDGPYKTSKEMYEPLFYDYVTATDHAKKPADDDLNKKTK